MIGIIGDLHLKEKLGYSEFFPDGRVEEKNKILDEIVSGLSDCESIVMLGDQLNARNNPSSVLKELVALMERFQNKHVYMIAGNHSKFGDGKSALDFLKEIKNKNWTVVTDTCEDVIIDGMNCVLCPYFSKAELGAKDDEEGKKLLMEILNKKTGKVLFCHQTISSFITSSNCLTDSFNEIILSKKDLEKKFDKVFAGHIHKPQDDGKIVLCGSIFNNEVGEDGKFIFKVDKDLSVKKIKLSGTSIIKIEDPSLADLEKIDKNSLVKLFFNKKADDIDLIREYCRNTFKASIIIEQLKTERAKSKAIKGELDFSIENLIKIYAKEKKLKTEDLIEAYELIRN